MAVFSGNGSATSPSFTFSSDTNLGIYRENADLLGFATAGSGQMFLDSFGRLLLGSPSSVSFAGIQAASQVTTGTGTPGRCQLISYFQNDANGPFLALGKSRSNTLGTHTYPTSGDNLGTIAFAGSNQAISRFDAYANITSFAAETWTASARGSELRFYTTDNGTAVVDERVRITHNGYLRMASGSGGIQFGGDTAAANALDDYEEGTWTVTIDHTKTSGFVASPNLNPDHRYVKIGKFVHCQVNFNWDLAQWTDRITTPLVFNTDCLSWTLPYQPKWSSFTNVTAPAYAWNWNQSLQSTNVKAYGVSSAGDVTLQSALTIPSGGTTNNRTFFSIRFSYPIA